VSAPGDIGFVCQHDWTAFWIQVAQRVKYGKGSPAARWNHVFIVTDDVGGIIQANQSGVERGHLRQYIHDEYELRRPPYAPGGGQIVAEAATHHLGRKYGWLTIASVTLSLLTGTKLRFGIAGDEICSGEAADDVTRANIDVGPDESFSTPADLYAVALAEKWAVVV
jgi:hypothetical protein